MSKKFNLDDYKGKYVMHCKTEEEAKDFCRVLHEAGRKWSSGDSYLALKYWDCYRDDICYNFNEGVVCDTKYYAACKFTILEWSDFMSREFTRDDLKNGDIVLRRDGEVEIHIQGRLIDCDGIACHVNNMNVDLTNIGSHNYDIISVIRPVTLSDLSFDAFEKKLGRVVYERDETVEMTLEEVCKALGKNVKIVKEK